MKVFRIGTVIFSMVLGLPVVVSEPVAAQDAVPAEIADLVDTCNSCHGEDGKPVMEEAPVIWGQENYYMYVQMKDMKSGLRASEIMGPIVADLSKDQMKALAKYYSAKTWPKLGYFTPEADIPVAENAAVSGQCTQCHLGAWTGNSRVPRLAGQTAKYLENTMRDFKNSVRKNAPDMGSFLRDMTDAELASLARYGAGK